MRLNQVTVGATDFAESVRFYTALGLRLIVSAREEYARFELPEGEATFSVHRQSHVPPDGPVIYFEVEDVDAAAARIVAQGYPLLSGPADQSWLWREARLADPAGNTLCLFHGGPNRRFPPWRIAAAAEGIDIRRDDPRAAHVADLLALHLRELRGDNAEYSFALDASGLSAPGVTFWTAWEGESLMGFGAVKELAPDHGEVKSMRAAPSARRKGVGRRMLVHIIAEARARGYRALSLETGTVDLYAPAIALYRSVGFVPCEAFADYVPSPHNQFFRLNLMA